MPLRLAAALVLALATPALAGTRPPAIPKTEPLFHLDFEHVEILEIVKFISHWTGRNFIVPEGVHGRITIISPTPVTAQEAYDVFLSALLVNHYTLVETGAYLKVVPTREQ